MAADSIQSFFEDERPNSLAAADANPEVVMPEGLEAEAMLPPEAAFEVEGAESEAIAPMQFRSHFIGCMELYADAATVSAYLDAHQGWFCRCAHPMQVEPMGANGYLLIIGRYGSFGYTVEPKIALDLLPQQQGVYRIETIPLAEQSQLNYQVDFQAELQLNENPVEVVEPESPELKERTHVEWQLDLQVAIVFPRFIYRLPRSLVQGTGDRLLGEIVRQVSHRLTAKVQDDFHTTLGIKPSGRLRRHRTVKV